MPARSGYKTTQGIHCCDLSVTLHVEARPEKHLCCVLVGAPSC